MTYSLRTAALIAALIAPTVAPTSSFGDSLHSAMVAAYNNSNLLEQNRALLRAQDEGVAIALSALRPQIGLTSSVTYSDNEVQGGDLSSTVSIGMDLLLYDGGNTELAVAAAKETVLAARAQLVGQEQLVLLGAVQAYVNILRDSRIVGLRQSNLRLITQELRAARDRFEVGEVTRTDVAQAEARLAAARGEVAQAQGNLDISRQAYKLATGKAPGRLDGVGTLPRLPKNVAAATALGVRDSPDVRSAQIQIRADQFNQSRARTAIKPQINMSASVGHSSTANNNSSIGMNMTIPIYQGGQLTARMRSSTAQVHASRAALNQRVLETRQNVADSWTRLEVARAQVAASDRQIRAAQIAFQGVREEAKLGARTTLDVLDAEQVVSDARTNRISNLSSVRIATYQLLAAMGQLTTAKLALPVKTYDVEEYYNAVKNAPVKKSKEGRKLDRILQRYSK